MTSEKPKVWLYLLLLTLQYGSQPLLSKRFVRREVIVTSLVLACEVAKVICAVGDMCTLKKLFQQWSLVGSLTASALPAAIYAVQNSLLQISYKNLDSLTFYILNQTKLLFTAFLGYGNFIFLFPLYTFVYNSIKSEATRESHGQIGKKDWKIFVFIKGKRREREIGNSFSKWREREQRMVLNVTS